MSTLYVVEVGSRLEKEYHRLLVTKEDEVLMRVPLRYVDRVVLVGTIGMTTPAMNSLLYNQIPVFLVSRTGSLTGRLLPPTSSNFGLRQAQYENVKNDIFRFQFAKAIVAGKLHNQRVLALRVLRRHKEIPRAGIEAIKTAEKRVEQAEDMDTLRGIEGGAARAYFSIFQAAFDGEWQFERRTRRPPRDPVNALLSLGYIMLGNAIEAGLEIVGLDPYIGYFHELKPGRPALSLDLLEEFRAPFVDSLVMSLLNRKVFSPKDFYTDQTRNNGVYLEKAAYKEFLHAFSDRLESEIHIPGVERAMSYRKILEIQGHKLRRVLQGKDVGYSPFSAR